MFVISLHKTCSFLPFGRVTLRRVEIAGVCFFVFCFHFFVLFPLFSFSLLPFPSFLFNADVSRSKGGRIYVCVCVRMCVSEPSSTSGTRLTFDPQKYAPHQRLMRPNLNDVCLAGKQNSPSISPTLSHNFVKNTTYFYTIR